MRTIPLVVVVFTFVLSACQESTVGPTAASSAAATEGEVMLGAVEGLNLSSAEVADGFGCIVGLFGGYPVVFTTDSHATESNSGKVTLTCHGQLPAGAEPDEAVVQRSEDVPGVCNALFAIATRWQQVISPSGEITLRCQAL
ncbi:MAG: hypothetical protein KAI97_02675 [Gemmatimonadetes bacterium]|nr:hypothetical protein [Gemmatimonadota bacterium]